MPRNCNYSNVDRIIQQAQYDEDKNIYRLPELTRDEVQLPHMGGNAPITTNGRMIQQTDEIIPSKTSNSTPLVTNDYEDDFVSPNGYAMANTDDVGNRYVRNYEPVNLPPEKQRIKRQEHLLNESSLLQRNRRPLQSNNINENNDYMNRRLNPYEVPARLSQKYGFSSNKQ